MSAPAVSRDEIALILVALAVLGLCLWLIWELHDLRVTHGAEAAGRDLCEHQLGQLRGALAEQQRRDQAAHTVIRQLQQALNEQREIARVAADAGQALVHEHARLIAALQEACAFLVGGYDERERIAGIHRLDLAALGHCATAAALASQWHGLIAECEAGAGEPPDPLPPAPPLDHRHLRVVGGTAARPATAADRLITTGPIGA